LGACYLGGSEPPEQSAAFRFFTRLGLEYEPRFSWTAVTLAAIGTALAAWAWLGRRWRRGGSLCPRCSYDLSGIVTASAYPLKCSECGFDIESGRALTRPHRARRFVGAALLVFVAAYVTARGPEVKRSGWIRLAPSTYLVLQPMNVTAWTEAKLDLDGAPTMSRASQKALDRRLRRGTLWSWQEWILFKRIERVFRSRDDYGITPLQYEMAVRIETTPADAWNEETLARRLARIAELADVPLVNDWEGALAGGWNGNDVVEPVVTHGTVADALDELFAANWHWFANWDIGLDGLVMSGESEETSTSRARIYDVSAFLQDPDDAIELVDLITEIVRPGDWICNGGLASAAFEVADHLVVIAPTRAHFEIEDLLDNLGDALSAKPPFIHPHQPPDNPRAFRMMSQYPTGLLDNLRLARTVTSESLRAAGPMFDDGMTEAELDACNRGAFGLLDTCRRSASSPLLRQSAE
jgi:hypothetical protein